MADLMTLADVHAHLNISNGDTSHDVELQGFMDAASELVEYYTGPITPKTFTETHNGGWPTIIVDNPPIQAVLTVTEYLGTTGYALTSQPLGATTSDYGFSVDDPAAGVIVRRSSAGQAIPFRGGERAVLVVYTAGLAAVPASVRMAALEDLRGLYQQTQQGGRPAFGGLSSSEDDSYGSSPMRQFPRLVHLLSMYGRTPAIA